MLGDRWICDRVPTERFPDYTRGNAGEVLADPVSPLAWTFCWEPGPVQGCVDGFEQMGVFDRIEYGDPPGLVRLVRRLLLQLAHPVAAVRRALRRRLGGGRPDVLRQRQPGDPALRRGRLARRRVQDQEARARRWGGSRPPSSVPEAELQKLEAKALRDSRPDLAAQTDEQLVARAFSIQRHLRVQFSSVVWASMGSSVGPGVLPALLGEVEPDAIAKLMAGIGDVDSAGIATQIFDMSRHRARLGRADGGVRRRPRRPARPLGGVGLRRRAAVPRPRSTTSCTTTAAAGRTNGTSTSAATRRTRRCCCRRSSGPVSRRRRRRPRRRSLARGAAERQRLIDKYEAAFADNAEALGALPDRGAHRAGVDGAPASASSRATSAATTRCGCASTSSAGGWSSAATSPTLGRSTCSSPTSSTTSWPTRRRSPPGWPSASRTTSSLYELEPPYIVNGAVPPLGEWKRRGEGDYQAGAGRRRADRSRRLAGRGDRHRPGHARPLRPVACSSPATSSIAPSTDPSWTPLFLVAEGVITDIGAVAHARRDRQPRARASRASRRSPTPPSASPTGRRSRSTAASARSRSTPCPERTGVRDSSASASRCPSSATTSPATPSAASASVPRRSGSPACGRRSTCSSPLEPSAPYAARPGMPVPEAYRSTMSPLELLTAAAAWTEHVVLGTGILVGGYHRPVELAQRLATLDQLSGGRSGRRAQRRLVEGRARPDGRRVRDAAAGGWTSSWTHARGLLGPGPGGVRRVSSSRSRRRSSAPNPCSSRARRCSRACARRPACGARRRCSTSGTRHRASIEQIIDDRRRRSTRCDRRAPRRSRSCSGSSPSRRSSSPGLAPMTIDQMAESVAAARDAGVAHVVVDTGFTTEVASPDDWAYVPRPPAPLVDAGAVDGSSRRARRRARPAPRRRRSRGSSANRRPRHRPGWRRSRRGRGSPRQARRAVRWSRS